MMPESRPNTNIGRRSICNESRGREIYPRLSHMATGLPFRLSTAVSRSRILKTTVAIHHLFKRARSDETVLDVEMLLLTKSIGSAKSSLFVRKIPAEAEDNYSIGAVLSTRSFLRLPKLLGAMKDVVTHLETDEQAIPPVLAYSSITSKHS